MSPSKFIEGKAQMNGNPADLPTDWSPSFIMIVVAYVIGMVMLYLTFLTILIPG